MKEIDPEYQIYIDYPLSDDSFNAGNDLALFCDAAVSFYFSPPFS